MFNGGLGSGGMFGGGLGVPRNDLKFHAPFSNGLVDIIGISSRPVKKLQHILMNGTGTLNNANLTATCAITQPNGTSVLAAGAGAITGTAGTVWTFSVLYDDGAISLYEYAALVGTASAVVFDVSGNGRHLILTGFADVPAACVESVTAGSDWLNQNGYNDASVGLVPYSSIAASITETIPEADYYVNKAGLDTNDGLTEGAAFLTIGRAITVAPDGSVIYVGPGTYTENKDATFGLDITKSVQIYGVGGTARIQTTTGQYLCNFNDTLPIKIGSGIEFYSQNGRMLRFGNTGSVAIDRATIATTQETGNNIFYTSGDCQVAIRRCTINCTAATAYLLVDTSKSKHFEIFDNTINIGSTTTSLFYFSGGSRNLVYVDNNVTIGSLAGVSGGKAAFHVLNNTGLTTAYGNTTTLPADDAGAYSPIYVTASTVGAKGGADIHDNTATVAASNGYGVIVGAESSSNGNNTISPIRVYNNRVTGTGTNSTHGILVGYQADALVYGNIGDTVGYGLVLKGNGTSHVNGITFGNVFKNCTRGVFGKGTTALNIHNNTFVDCGTDILLNDFETGVPENIKAKNNAHSGSGLFFDNQASSPTGFESDYNIGIGSSKILTVTSDLTAWKLLGYDAHSSGDSPQILGNYSILATSPCYQGGTAITLPAGLITDALHRMCGGAALNVGASAGFPLTPNGSTTPTDALGGHIAADRLGRVKYSFSGGKWPSAAELIARTGVDNAVYDANGDGIDFGEDYVAALAALAALASLADDQYLFGGTKAAVLYNENKTAQATIIKRAVGDTA